MIDGFDRHLPRGAEVRSTESTVGRVTGRCSGAPASNGWLSERRPTPGEAIAVAIAAHHAQRHGHAIASRTDASWLIGRQVRSVFFVTLIPCALSHALCSACAFVSAAVLGKLACLRFGVAILITRVIRLAPAERTGEYYGHPDWFRAVRSPRR
jgi:hypothetical protein